MIVKPPILMLQENGSTHSISRLSQRRSRKQHFQGQVVRVARRLISTSTDLRTISTANSLQRTSSKATTSWDLYALYPYVPKVLYQGLRNSRHYVSSSDCIKMQCDSSRSQSENRAENHRKLFDEITRIYRQRVPGITPPEQVKKIAQL